MQGSFAPLAYRAKLLAPSPASTLSSTNLHLIIFGQLVQAGFFVSFPTAKSLCVHERSGAVGFDLRDSFPLSFSSVLFFSSSSFLSHSASGFSLPLSCSCLVCPAAASSTALQALPGSDLQLHARKYARIASTRFISSIFRRPVGSTSVCLVFFPPSSVV